MSGLLGLVAAGAAKGFAEGQSRAVAAQREFDLRKELQAAELEMNMQLKRAGVEIEEQARDRERKKIEDVVTKAKKDPNEGKGGYVTPEMAEAEAKAADKRAADALFEQGYLDAGGKYLDKTTAADKAKLDQQKLDATIQKNQELIELGLEKIKSQREISEAKNETNLAKLQALKDREKDKSDRKTDQDKEYEAYVDSVEKYGRQDSEGKLSKLPMSRDKYFLWKQNQNQQNSRPRSDLQAMWDDYRKKYPKEAAKTTFGEFAKNLEVDMALAKRGKTTQKPKETKATPKFDGEYIPGKGYVRN